MKYTPKWPKRVQDELDRLHKEIRRLREVVGETQDGVLLCDVDDAYCPHCGTKVHGDSFTAYCDNCPNPDGYGTPPLPMFWNDCYAKQENVPKEKR